MSSADRLARLRYEPNGYSVLTTGSHVRCAVTGELIALNALRYWSVERQEAYANGEVATQRLAPDYPDKTA